MTFYKKQIDRRVTLKWLVATAAVAAAPTSVTALTAGAKPQQQLGYWRDPDLSERPVPWDTTLSDRELQVTATLADIILPEEGKYPAPSAIGIPDFIDEWVSAPYPQQQKDAKIIVPGLRWLDAEAKRRGAAGFIEAGETLQIAIITDISDERNAQYGFFYGFRAVLLGAYYTTRVGFDDIGYIGNVALEEYPGTPDHMKVHIDNELKRLGIL